MMELKLIGLAFLLCFTVPQASAGLTAGKLLDSCKGSGDIDEGFCLGYVAGYTDSHEVILLFMEIETDKALKTLPLFCMPDKVNVGQLQAIYIKWAEENPDLWHIEVRLAFPRALQSAFPCPE